MPENDFSIAPENIGSFTYRGRSFYIWESTRNAGMKSARLWQFRYAPLLLPEFGADGTLVVRELKIPTGRRCVLTLSLCNGTTDRLAFEAVQRRYPTQAEDIQDSNVTVLPLASIHFAIDDLATQVPGARLLEEASLFLTNNSVPLIADLPDAQTAELFREYLPAATLKYAVSFDAKSTRQNAVSVNYRDLKASRLFTELDGKGTTDVYIHRDDLRQLTEGLSRTVEAVGVVEDPARFDSDVFTKILTTLTQGISSAAFDDQKWRSTYNGDDLKPDIVSKTLNKLFTKDENENHWKYHADVDTGAKADLFKLVSAEARLKGSYDDEGLKRALAERGIETQFEGTRIVAKSLALRQLNLAQFDVDAKFQIVTTYVADSSEVRNGSIALATLTGPEGVPDIGSRLAALERLQRAFEEPIHTLRPFLGSIVEAEKQRVVGWWVCDGRIVDDNTAPAYHGKPTPDLRDRFVLASDTPGRVGGSAQFVIGDQTVTVDTVGWNASVTVHADPRLLVYSAMGWVDGSPIRSQGTVRGANVATIPPFYSTIWLVKVR